MSEPNPEAQGRTPLAKCERHGLHYDPAKMTGCVICRREAQAEAGGPAPSSSSAAPATRHPLAGPLLVTAALCFGAGFAFYQLHHAAAKLAGATPEMPAFTRRQQTRQIEEALREMSAQNPAAMTSEIEDDLPENDLPPGPGVP